MDCIAYIIVLAFSCATGSSSCSAARSSGLESSATDAALTRDVAAVDAAVDQVDAAVFVDAAGTVAAVAAEVGADPSVATATPEILFVFFGFDDAPGLALARVSGCAGLTGLLDGMPVVLGDEVASSLDASDFVVRRDGIEIVPVCATLRPANEESEDRTVLLIGQFGSASAPPEEVEIVGALNGESVSLLGAFTEVVTPEPAGPSLVLASRLSAERAQIGEGNGCPAGTTQVVQVVWQGGVSVPPRGADPGDEERMEYRVTVRAATGAERELAPFAIGDLDDGDNNHDLCLDTADVPLRVAIDANVFVDPGGDFNPATDADIRLEAP